MATTQPDHPSLLSLPARVLSNGTSWVLLTASGTGCSVGAGLALTAWAGDRVEDEDGFFFYLRDLESRAYWSVTPRPASKTGSRSEFRSSPGVAVILGESEGIETRLEVCVAEGRDLELRRLTIRNRSAETRALEVTSFAEIVLNHPAAHAAHPVFSKLFLQTARDAKTGALIASRRRRSHEERYPCLVHAVHGATATEHETDRWRFLGRGGSSTSPAALTDREALSGTTGNVLDPVFSLRFALKLRAGEEQSVVFSLATVDSAAEAVRLVVELDEAAIESAYAGARASALARLRALEIEESHAEDLENLAYAILCGHPGLGGRAALSRGIAEGLARMGVALNRPLVVLREAASAELERRFEMMHRYWNALGLPIDAIALGRGSETLSEGPPSGGPGRFVRISESALAVEDRAALLAAASLEISDHFPRIVPDSVHPAFVGESPAPSAAKASAMSKSVTFGGAAEPSRDRGLLFDNGFGGFSPDGREYILRLARNPDGSLRLPPLPWVNVIANERFGFIASETGAGTTWSGNSREHRLTPWLNDPVRDPHSEALYLRDEDAGSMWSLLPGPVPGPTDYEVRHAWGWSAFRAEPAGLEHETMLFVPRNDAVKVSLVRIRERAGKSRRLTIACYARLVMGDGVSENGRHVITESELESGLLFATSSWSATFAGRTAFSAVVASDSVRRSVTCDRLAFLGPGGSVRDPHALRSSAPLDGACGAGLDPCFAWKIALDLQAGGTVELAFLLGEEEDRAAARRVVARYSALSACREALEGVRSFWLSTAEALTVETPSPALDLLLNGWLPYQVLSCRLWGRSAFYQSGGAFGFRDQLQDAGALVHVRPDLFREQILLHASHQFEEGDVLHWWHPPQSRGIRTRFADDLLWLPQAVARYVRATGDSAILDEEVRFLKASPLLPGEDERFVFPEDAGARGDLYEHCCRALDRSLRVGSHGLPLFGTGDWNDGMNRVGREGRGESVWMAFFLFDVLGQFGPLCVARGDAARRDRYEAHRSGLRHALEMSAWDGDWYRRGYYDDGAPLGTRGDDECRIDALVQAWSVLSGAVPRERAERAMDAVERELVHEQAGIIRLLAPPFDRTPKDPGYIKGYVPGVRENGGQYTHAALWVVQAMAELGRRDRAAPLLDLLNPVLHASSPETVAVYCVEPYVIAADVYGVAPHEGRGGWTWYTGSAGWMIRVALETILGFSIEEGRTLVLRPRIPDAWPGFGLRWRVPAGGTRYEIRVENVGGRDGRVTSATLDGAPAPVEDGAARVRIDDDGAVHRVVVLLG